MRGVHLLIGILVLGNLAWLAATVLENRRLHDRIAVLERAAASRPAVASSSPAPAAPPSEPIVLPSNDVAHLEARLALLEARLGAEVAPPSISPPSGGDAAAPAVTSEFRQGVLAVLAERDAEKAAQDAERAKKWQSGVVDWQVNDLATRLQLSPTQKEQVHAIFLEGWQKLTKLWQGLWGTDGTRRLDGEQLRVETEKLTSEVDGKAKALLSIEQATAYDAWRKEQNRWWQGNRGGGR